MAFRQGDLVWAWLPYSDGTGGRERPVLVVSTRNRGKDITVAQLSSKIAKARRRGEYVLQRWEDAGLDGPSALRPKVFVILKSRVITGRRGRIGHIHADDRPGMIASLRGLFGL